MIHIDTAAGIELAGAAFNGVWNLFTSPAIPLGAWFASSWWLLLSVKKDPSKDWVAGAKFFLSGLVLGVTLFVDLIRWAQS